MLAESLFCCPREKALTGMHMVSNLFLSPYLDNWDGLWKPLCLESRNWSLGRKNEFSQWCYDDEKLERNSNDLQERWFHSLLGSFIPMSKHLMISIFFSSLSLILTVASLYIKNYLFPSLMYLNSFQNLQLFRLNTHLLSNTELFPRLSMGILYGSLKPEQNVWGWIMWWA